MVDKMKEQMSGFDIRRMVTELSLLKGGWMKKAYQPHHEQVVLRINPKEGRQQDMVIVRGKRIYLSSRDRPMPPQPSPFSMLLRKHLGNARLERVEQHGFDRIIILTFDSKVGIRHLVIECFRDGNIILSDESHIIIQPLTHATYAGRTLKRGEPYRFPPEAMDPHSLDTEGMSALLQNSDSDLVRTLAGKANLGGPYARAVCSIAGIEPSIKASEVANESKMITKVSDALSGLLDKLATSRISWLISKESTPEDIEEATPLLLPGHVDRTTIEMPSLAAAIDAWMGEHDASALARRYSEMEAVSPRGGSVGTVAERLERRLTQQEKALASFDVKVKKMQELGHAITDSWEHVDDLLSQTRDAVEKLGWDKVRKQIGDSEWLQSCDPAQRTLKAVLPDKTVVELHLDESVHQNAKRWFDKGRKQRDKGAGARIALENTRKELAKARKEKKKLEASGKVSGIRRSRRLWFERHRWSILDSGHLMVGGRDAKGNDMLVKKHLRSDDRYVHADLHGASSCVMKLKAGFIDDPHPPSSLPQGVPALRLVDTIDVVEFSEEAQTQAATMSLAWSRAWNAGRAGGTVFWARPGQVSKSAETGEFIGKGSFIIRGQRNWIRDVSLELAIGLVCINAVPLLLCGTDSGVSQICQRWASIRPGGEKKEAFANRLAKAIGLSIDDIVPVLPGHCELVEDHGLLR